MAIGDGAFLLLQQRDKLYMLLGKAGKYHLITVDRRFTPEKEEKLLSLYPCSEAALRELGITFTALSVRGVASAGWEAGDELLLYVGKKKQRYVLSDDTSQACMDALFAGVQQYPVPVITRGGPSLTEWYADQA